MVSDSDAASLSSSPESSVLDDCHALAMTSDAMKNAGVRAGDGVKVTPAPDVKFGKNVLILPFQDSIDSIDSKDLEDFDLFDEYLRPYFEGKFRTLYRGDSFTIDGSLG